MKTRMPFCIGMAVSLFAMGWGQAQEVRYDLTGNYPSTAPVTSLTAPGGAFDFEFLVPASVANSTPPNSPFFIEVPILSGAYTFGGSTSAVSSGTYFYASSGGNLTDISLTTSVGDIQLASPSSYGPLVLATGPDTSGQSHFLTGDLGTGVFTTIDFTSASGNGFSVEGTTASIVGVAVPEPSSLGLMALGLLSCGGVAFLRHGPARRKGPA
jgi:PEP-CTERM motif